MNHLWELDSLNTVVAYKPVYARLAGDVEAGLLLSQILYWFKPSKSGKSKLRVVHDGRRWLAKGRSDWKAEIGLSAKQYDRAIKKLVAAGLVQVVNRMFGGKVMPHIWLDAMAASTKLAELMASEPVVGAPEAQEDQPTIFPNEENPFCPNGKTHLPDSGKPLQKTTAETTTVIVAGGPAGAPASSVLDLEWVLQDPKWAEQQLKTSFTANWWKMKAREILAARDGGLRAKDIGNGVRALEMLWKKRLSTEFPGYVKALTKQETGQLRLFVQKVGEQSGEALDYALTHWMTFAAVAAADAGLGTYPHKPHVGFVLAHYGTLLQLIAKAKASAVAPQIAKPATPKPETPAKIDKMANKASLEQVLAAIGGGKK